MHPISNSNSRRIAAGSDTAGTAAAPACAAGFAAAGAAEIATRTRNLRSDKTRKTMRRVRGGAGELR